MTIDSLNILLIGSKDRRSPIIKCLEQIKRWSLNWKWASPEFQELEACDIGIFYGENLAKNIQENLPPALDSFPIIVVGADPKLADTNVEFIPFDQLNPLTLEYSIRLLLPRSVPDNIVPQQNNRDTTNELQEYIRLSKILVKFSQILSNPDFPKPLDTAIGLFGHELNMQKATVLAHKTGSSQNSQLSMKVVAQWSEDSHFLHIQTRDSFPPNDWHEIFIEQNDPMVYHCSASNTVKQKLKGFGIRAFLVLPVRDAADKLWGYLTFTSDRPGKCPYSTLTLQTLQMATELIHHHQLRVTAQRELAASEQLYSSIVLHSAEAIFLCRMTPQAEPLFEMANPTYYEALQVDNSQLIDKTPQEIFSPELAEQIKKSLRTCYHIGEAILFEEILSLPSGEHIWRTSLIPIRDRHGNITHIQSSSRDITKERELELAKIRRTRNQRLLASISMRVLESWQTDEMLATTVLEIRRTLQADRVIFFELTNQHQGCVTQESVLDYQPAMLGKRFSVEAFDRGDFSMFHHGEIQTCIDVNIAKFPQAHHDMLVENNVQAYAVLPILVSASEAELQGEPQLKGLICVHQCEAVKPWLSEDLQLLRQLTNQISIAFNQADLLYQQQRYLKELARSNEELAEFAYIASHDLQEPLQIVSNYAQLLKRKNKEKLDDRSQRYIFHMVEGTKRMQQQIQDLLKYSRLNTRQYPFKKVEMLQPLNQAIANLQIRIKKSQATIKCPDLLPTIYGHGNHLQNLWQNLLGNAIKYSGDRPPHIHITCQQQDNQWLFKVIDNGIGIDPQYHERIFQRLQRLHTDEEYRGTGIGLAICRRIIKLHGGKLWVESQEDQGSTFVFSLPITAPS